MPTPTSDPEAAAAGLDAGPAIVCGLLGVGAALAAGDLVAGLLSPVSSPVLAVGGVLIRLTPEWLKSFAIATFGVYDKLALLVGMAVVLFLVAAAGGLASRRSPMVGALVILALGVVAVVSVVAAPTSSSIDLAAPLAALVAGLAVWLVLHRLGMRRASATAGDGNLDPEDHAGPEGAERTALRRAGPVGSVGSVGTARRMFVLGVAGAAVGAGAAAVAGRLLAAAGGADASRAAVGALQGAPGLPIDLTGADFAAQGPRRG